jgi:hypothetical protein
VDRRHGHADLGPQAGDDELLASGRLDRVDDAGVFPGVDERTVDRLLIRKDVLETLDEVAAALLDDSGQDRRDPEQPARLIASRYRS